jgi:co-chaperonin GroES (HSP10)
MSKSIQKIMEDDTGIDFENYNLEEEVAKYQGDSPKGWQVVIRVYVPQKISKVGSIFLADNTVDQLNKDNKLINFTGLVVKLSTGAYKDDRYKLTGPYCKVGDWVMFPRAHGTTYSYNGLTTITLNEDAVLKVIDDPRSIARISV